MKYLIIFALCLISTVKMSCQSAFAKKGVKTSADSLLFISMIFAFSSLTFLPYLIYITPVIWGYAALFGICSVAFQLFYTRALSEGNVSLTVMIANFSMLIPVTISCVFFGERPSVLRIVGIALTICSFIAAVKPEGKTTKRSLIFAILSMLANGALSTTQKFFSATEYSDKNLTFASASYLIASVLALLIYFVFAARGHKKTFQIGKKPLLAALGTGVSLGCFLALNTYATATIDGTFLFPVYAGGAIIFATVSGLIFFHDRFTVRQVISLVLGTCALVLMNF